MQVGSMADQPQSGSSHVGPPMAAASVWGRLPAAVCMWWTSMQAYTRPAMLVSLYHLLWILAPPEFAHSAYSSDISVGSGTNLGRESYIQELVTC